MNNQDKLIAIAAERLDLPTALVRKVIMNQCYQIKQMMMVTRSDDPTKLSKDDPSFHLVNVGYFRTKRLQVYHLKQKYIRRNKRKWAVRQDALDSPIEFK